MAGRTYSQWAGKPAGTPENLGRCVEAVWRGYRAFYTTQCYRKRGHGPNGEYCKQHAKKQEGSNGQE